MGCDISPKIHFLHVPLKFFFPENKGDVKKEYEELLHQQVVARMRTNNAFRIQLYLMRDSSFGEYNRKDDR